MHHKSILHDTPPDLLGGRKYSNNAVKWNRILIGLEVCSCPYMFNFVFLAASFDTQESGLTICRDRKHRTPTLMRLGNYLKSPGRQLELQSYSLRVNKLHKLAHPKPEDNATSDRLPVKEGQGFSNDDVWSALRR